MDKKPIKYIKIKAINNLQNRRFKTLKGLTLKQFKELREGKAVKIPTFAFDKNIFMEVDNGNS